MNADRGDGGWIWKLLVKGWLGAARSFVPALALLLCATTLGQAAEPADATIVLQLQLPPSTSPETVRGLIADLAAKGAHPVTQPAITGCRNRSVPGNGRRRNGMRGTFGC